VYLKGLVLVVKEAEIAPIPSDRGSNHRQMLSIARLKTPHAMPRHNKELTILPGVRVEEVADALIIASSQMRARQLFEIFKESVTGGTPPPP
jgi:hypothetical protein